MGARRAHLPSDRLSGCPATRVAARLTQQPDRSDLIPCPSKLADSPRMTRLILSSRQLHRPSVELGGYQMSISRASAHIARPNGQQLDNRLTGAHLWPEGIGAAKSVYHEPWKSHWLTPVDFFFFFFHFLSRQARNKSQRRHVDKSRKKLGEVPEVVRTSKTSQSRITVLDRTLDRSVRIIHNICTRAHLESLKEPLLYLTPTKRKVIYCASDCSVLLWLLCAQKRSGTRRWKVSSSSSVAIYVLLANAICCPSAWRVLCLSDFSFHARISRRKK